MIQRLARFIKHTLTAGSRRVLSPVALNRLTQRVAASEVRHSGQIRICVEAGLPISYLLRRDSTPMLTRERALAQFGALRVWDTAHNNGVLIYLLLAEHAIELVADRGINAHVGAQQWQSMVQQLGVALRDGRFEDGLAQALSEVSTVLEAFFPAGGGDGHGNELPDAPVLT